MCKTYVNIDFSVAKVNIFHILNFERKVFKTCVFANVNHTHMTGLGGFLYALLRKIC